MSAPTVLLVEDEADILLTMRIALEVHGYRVLETTSAEDALVLLGGETPDLVLLDITLPGMDGWELLLKLGEQGRLAASPVVVVSAHVSEEVSRKAAALGASAYLTKPFDVEGLRKVVEDNLAGGAR